MATTTAPPTADPAMQEEESEPPRDEEGLLLHYDVVLCGTGLVQSLLASALARAGKSVLHCDGNDYYGEFDAVVPQSFDWDEEEEEEEALLNSEGDLSLRPRATVRLHSKATLSHVQIEVGTEVSTPAGIGEILSLPSSNDTNDNVSIKLKNWTMANGECPTLHVGISPDSPWQEQLELANILPLHLKQARQVLEQKRYFALDLTPSLLYASGPAVKALITSNVANYMEFKALEGLFWFRFSNETEESSLVRVPCSKGDVFATTLLSPLEKRRLMKFLQLTLDYSTAQQQQQQQEDETNNDTNETLSSVQSLNEHHLNQGRSLARPQNKAIATTDIQVLNESLEMPFCDYLEQHAKLSANVIQIVIHALALEPSDNSLTTKQGMFQLCQHVQSLGRFGTTAFIVPLYGCGELSQSFCRSAAVHGATYLLRRAPKRIIVNNDKVEGLQLSREDDSAEDKVIPCTHVVASADALSPKQSGRRLYRRISVVFGRLLSEQEEQRHVLIVPPGQVGNSCAIHGLVVDAAAGVAPPGCTVLHLTTTTTNANDENVNANVMLEKVVQELNGDEIHHVAFSYSLPDDEEDNESYAGIEGLHVCRPLGQSITLDSQVEQAKDIFESICPDVEFLTMSRKMDEIVKERLAGREEDDEDEERMFLESAMNMMQEPQAPSDSTGESGD